MKHNKSGLDKFSEIVSATTAERAIQLATQLFLLPQTVSPVCQHCIDLVSSVTMAVLDRLPSAAATNCGTYDADLCSASCIIHIGLTSACIHWTLSGVIASPQVMLLNQNIFQAVRLEMRALHRVSYFLQ